MANKLDNLKPPWKPGQSGNPTGKNAGRPRTRPMTDALKALLDKDDQKLLKGLVAVAAQKALGGDFRYWKEIMDRSDGKVMELLDVTSNGDSLAFPGLTAEQLAKLCDMEGGPK